MNLQERMNKLKTSYVKAFEKKTKLKYSFQRPEDVYHFGDYSTTFDEIVFFIDNNLSAKTFFGWWNLNVYHEFPITLELYARKEEEFKYETGFAYTRDQFWLKLMSDRIKSLNNE